MEEGREGRQDTKCVTSLSPGLLELDLGVQSHLRGWGAALSKIRAQGGEGTSAGTGRLIIYGIGQIKKHIPHDKSQGCHC